MGLFLSVNGGLKSPKQQVERPPSKKYTPIKIGNPLSISYLYFYLNGKDLERKTDALMISHFLKPKSSRNKAPEIVSYFDENCPLKQKSYVKIENFDPQNYGHRLVYYTKSYLGQDIDFTTKAMDVHQLKGGKKVVKTLLENAIPLVAGAANLPTFITPVVNAAKDKHLVSQAVELLFSVFFSPKAILQSEPVSFALNRPYRDWIQSGRFVVIPKIKEPSEKKQIMKNYILSNDNRLIKIQNPDEEFSKFSYYVFMVNGKPSKGYEDFESVNETAEILSNIIKPQKIDLSSMAGDVFDAVKNQKDLEALKIIVDETASEETKDAYLKLVSKETKKIAEKISI
ncbi:MAG: hypothetical protein OEL84_02795 [Nitrosopumilus sp.]|nr:hypothetical protein [Nitrosopumilus sp.]